MVGLVVVTKGWMKTSFLLSKGVSDSRHMMEESIEQGQEAISVTERDNHHGNVTDRVHSLVPDICVLDDCVLLLLHLTLSARYALQ